MLKFLRILFVFSKKSPGLRVHTSVLISILRDIEVSVGSVENNNGDFIGPLLSMQSGTLKASNDTSSVFRGYWDFLQSVLLREAMVPM